MAVKIPTADLKWSRLRSIGNSSIAKSAIAVPVLGYFLLFNDGIAAWLRLHSDICGPGECQVSWRLAFLYFGGCAFALGAVIYGLCCPDPVKRYGSASDYFLGEREIFWAHPNRGRKDLSEMSWEQESKQLEKLSEESLSRIGDMVLQAERGSLIKPIPQVQEANDRQTAIEAQQAYGHLDNGQPLARRSIAFLYAVGALLVGTPTLLTFAQISWRLGRRAVQLSMG